MLSFPASLLLFSLLISIALGSSKTNLKKGLAECLWDSKHLNDNSSPPMTDLSQAGDTQRMEQAKEIGSGVREAAMRFSPAFSVPQM